MKTIIGIMLVLLLIVSGCEIHTAKTQEETEVLIKNLFNSVGDYYEAPTRVKCLEAEASWGNTMLSFCEDGNEYLNVPIKKAHK